MKRLNLILLIILLILLGDLVYLYPKIGYSPTPVQWEVGSGWGRYYIITHGEIPHKEMAITWQSNIRNYATVDVLPKLLAAIINIVTGTVVFPYNDKFHQLFPWPGLIFLPIVVIAFYSKLSKSKIKEHSNLDIIVLYLFAMFPLASSTFSMSFGLTAANAVARALFLLLLSLFGSLYVEMSDMKKVMIFILILFPFFYYHHTWSYYFLIYAFGISILSLLTGDAKRYNIFRVFVLTMVAFFTSAIYYSTNLLGNMKQIILGLPKLFQTFFSVSSAMHVNREYIGYTPFSSLYGYIQFIGSLLIISIVILFLIQYGSKRYSYKQNGTEKFLLYCILSQFFVGVGLFAWEGILGVFSRFLEALIYVTMLVSAYLLAIATGKLKNIVRIILIVIALLCIVSFLIYPYELNWLLTNGEARGLSFAGESIPKTEYIFSDFRLGPPLVYYNQLAISTIDTYTQSAQIVDEILERCYYNVSNPKLVLDKIFNTKEYYVLLSRLQSKKYLVDPSLQRFKPASKDFLERWNAQPGFDKIYSGEVVLFRRAVT